MECSKSSESRSPRLKGQQGNPVRGTDTFTGSTELDGGYFYRPSGKLLIVGDSLQEDSPQFSGEEMAKMLVPWLPVSNLKGDSCFVCQVTQFVILHYGCSQTHTHLFWDWVLLTVFCRPHPQITPCKPSIIPRVCLLSKILVISLLWKVNCLKSECFSDHFWVFNSKKKAKTAWRGIIMLQISRSFSLCCPCYNISRDMREDTLKYQIAYKLNCNMFNIFKVIFLIFGESF